MFRKVIDENCAYNMVYHGYVFVFIPFERYVLVMVVVVGDGSGNFAIYGLFPTHCSHTRIKTKKKKFYMCRKIHGAFRTYHSRSMRTTCK